MTALIKQMSYRVLPSKEAEIQDLCNKFQAIINRNNMVSGSGREVSYKEELAFYSLIIPDIQKKTDRLKNEPELAQRVGLSKIVEEWIKKNGKKCSDYLKATGKPTLKNVRQEFISLLEDADSESVKEGGKKRKQTSKTKKKPSYKKKVASNKKNTSYKKK